MKSWLFLLAMISATSGCATSAQIKVVEDKLVADLQASDKSKPIQFTKIVVKLKRGEDIGAWQAGIFCAPNGDLTWKGGRISIDSDEFTETFKDELEAHSFKTVGDTDALFEDPSTWKSEILVAGLVKDLRINVCYPMAGFGNFSSAKGEAYLKVDWQIYSKLDRSVVHSVSTEGSAKSREASDGGEDTAILNAFAQATRHLLADDEFRNIVSRGGQQVTDTAFFSGEGIVISTDSSKALSASPDDWARGVVTVFAGTGHGSGFVISDNLIMTNHHVIGTSNAVTVKFSSGFEVTGKVLASNSGRDVAIVKVDAKLPNHFTLTRNLPKVGQDVYALGTPLDESFESTLSRGVVSAIREVDGKKFIQSDVNIRPGNSGGPLVDVTGSVVGIAVSGFQVNDVSQGINFFIPIDDAVRTLGGQ